MFLLFFKQKESKDQQVVEECTKQENNCEQVCTNCKCKLRDIEDYVVSTDTVIEGDTDQTKVQEENLEQIIEIENEEEESNTIDQDEMGDTNKVSML